VFGRGFDSLRIHRYNKTRPPNGGLFRFGEFPYQALLENENSPKRKEGCPRQTGFVVDDGIHGSTLVLPKHQALLEDENSPKRKEGCPRQTGFVVDDGIHGSTLVLPFYIKHTARPRLQRGRLRKAFLTPIKQLF